VIDNFKSPRVFASEIRQRVAPSDPLYIYADTMNDFNFYLEREVIPVLSQPSQLVALEGSGAYVLVRERDLKRGLADSASDWEVVIKGTTGSKEWALLKSQREENATN